MTDYKKACKWELGRYYEKLMAIDSLQDEIDMLTARMEGIRSPKMDACLRSTASSFPPSRSSGGCWRSSTIAMTWAWSCRSS